MEVNSPKARTSLNVLPTSVYSNLSLFSLEWATACCCEIISQIVIFFTQINVCGRLLSTRLSPSVAFRQHLRCRLLQYSLWGTITLRPRFLHPQIIASLSSWSEFFISTPNSPFSTGLFNKLSTAIPHFFLSLSPSSQLDIFCRPMPECKNVIIESIEFTLTLCCLFLLFYPLPILCFLLISLVYFLGKKML